MSQIKPSHVILSALLAILLGGCGDRNDKAVFSPEGGHSSDWVSIHKASARADVATCVECHGENYDGGVSKVSCMSQAAISGFTCHATSPAANLTGCVSCHGTLPGGPFGTSAPDRKAAHTKHTVLDGIGCDTCHLNAGSGTAGHARAGAAGGRSSATVASSAAFPFVYNADGTCSNVSCHGGKITPAWSGTISMVANVNSVCLQCHDPGNTQYNSFNSGLFSGTDPATNLHTSHLGRGSFCTDCHNIGTLTDFQKHFGGIADKKLTTPGNTIGGGFPTKIGAYTVSTKTCSTVACHVIISKTQEWIK